MRPLETELRIRHRLRWQHSPSITPGHLAPVIVRSSRSGNDWREFIFGAPGAEAEAIVFATVKAESLTRRCVLSSAFQSRRCLVVADGYYEWFRREERRNPNHFILRDPDMPMLLAGLWDAWGAAGHGGAGQHTFSICTVPANDLVGQVYERMPAILPRSQWAAWLAPDTLAESLAAMLRPYPGEEMECRHANLAAPQESLLTALAPGSE